MCTGLLGLKYPNETTTINFNLVVVVHDTLEKLIINGEYSEFLFNFLKNAKKIQTTTIRLVDLFKINSSLLNKIIENSENIEITNY